MVRPRTLSDETLLERATPLFWQQGYAATSVRDLTQATGLSTAALYHRFSDKEGLFLEVLQHYAQTGLVERLQRCAGFEDPVEAIRAFYEELIQRTLADSEHKGCLLINTVLDGAAVAPPAKAFVQECMAQLEQFFSTQLQRAVSTERLSQSTDVSGTALALVSLVFGLRISARLNPDPLRLRQLVECSLGAFLPVNGAPHD